ncbi:hypothetical protein RHSIM_Rhsim11G0074100 [Rhododendron simsii]|uniref:Uncharacterized protein n=1 Tax=Rhododendron simsii TaxID=118357 RepID=A0A834LBF0_RHOSS|nr:hypothetical protein RHSIM_Rhsim11G0074100 [Rhododendron simsii]
MGAKLVKKVKDGGGATEAAAENALAKAARTKLAAKVAAEGLVLPRRKRVLKMVWNYMLMGPNLCPIKPVPVLCHTPLHGEAPVSGVWSSSVQSRLIVESFWV